ncbi:class I SAM-dependent methyltransferase [Amycolatopsis sp. NPDC059027]|uniref:class I SAM-dependent methyltransferase n=1 Tax=Amycolatopsis sp. NPDC059027 TaxID=3346709 RepID=UPI00366B854B
MLTDTYRYPDTGDRVTGTFISGHEPYPGYWARSEERALDRLAAELTGVLGPRADVRALDAGCGGGRLLGWLSRFAATVTAADPDPGRLAEARAVTPPPDTALEFAVAPVVELDGGPYDLVLCSHVIQHVPTGDVTPLLRHLHELTTPDAVLVLAYSRAPMGRGGFSLDSVDDAAPGTVHSRRVGRAEFDHALRTAKSTTLPIRLLDPADVAAEAAAAGWRTTWEWTYHVLDDLGPADRHIDRDELVNASPPLRRHLGRDQLAVLRRTAR